MTLVNAYTTLAIVTEELGRADTDSTRAASIERAINASARQIDRFCGRPHGFWQDPTVVVREFAAEDTRCLQLPVDISTTTGLIVKIDEDGDGTFETTLTITTDFRLLPLNAAADGRPFEELIIPTSSTYAFPVHSTGQAGVQITAKFGWPTGVAPDDVAQANVVQAIHLYKGPAAGASGVLAVGVDGLPQRMPRMHPLAAALLEPAPYSKPRVG